MTNHEPGDLDVLDEATINPDPIKQFQNWFTEAINAGIPLADAMTVATVDDKGRPHARVLLLKQVDEDGFVFFTNYRSAKGLEIAGNRHVALCFHWAQLERQVRVEGIAEKVSAGESQAYFQTRPRESQIGAWVSPQSEVIENREALEREKEVIEERFRGREVECPDHWGGYRLTPTRIEFWKGRLGRLHDRILFERSADGAWSIKRLAP